MFFSAKTTLPKAPLPKILIKSKLLIDISFSSFLGFNKIVVRSLIYDYLFIF